MNDGLQQQREAPTTSVQSVEAQCSTEELISSIGYEAAQPALTSPSWAALRDSQNRQEQS